jgi:N-acetylglucosamine-6-phosphate deacetylase
MNSAGRPSAFHAARWINSIGSVPDIFCVGTREAVGSANVGIVLPDGAREGLSEQLVAAGTVVSGSKVLRPGWLRLNGARITEAGSGQPSGRVTADLGEQLVIPGFVDIHVHGGGGGSFTTGDPIDIRRAVSFHRSRGTTTTLASLVTDPRHELLRSVAILAELVDGGLLAGIHLEGPWLSERRRGAHEVGQLRDPDQGELLALLKTGRGAIKMITLAPERTGALDAIKIAIDHGAIAAVGHTDASYDQTQAAITAGARVATHLFNAMRPIHHREPGPIPALLESPDVVVELVHDGTHLHPAIYRHTVRSVGSERLTLVTDAMTAAGMADGTYRLGSRTVEVAAGEAKVAGTETLAGSTATMDGLFRNAIQSGSADPDEALLAAVRQTSTTPARVLGLEDRSLSTGDRADLVVLDADLTPTAVMIDGSWIS